jgi:glycosyltransferase involved in cell wall biosynthesis
MSTERFEQKIFWRFKQNPGWKGVLVRGVGLALLLAPFLTGKAWLTWLCLPVWLVIWLTAAAKRAFFIKNLDQLPKLSATSGEARVPKDFPRVTVIAPGRNEEEGVEAAARSLAMLDYPNLEVICINDHSTDRTGEILDRLAKEHPNLRVIHDPPLQEGWPGKSNAIWHAVSIADPSAKWILLTDADVVFDPQALRQGIAAAEEEGADFFTGIPYLETGTFVEELVLPIQWSGLVAGSSPKRNNDSKYPPVGIGAFILVKREAYLKSGGHSAFYAQQPEDALLALAVREWGGRLAVGYTDSLFRVRLYRGYKQLMSYWVRKNRIGGDDRLAFFGSMMLFWLLMMVVPLPFGIAAVIRQVASGHFSVGWTLYALMALLSYREMSKAMDDARAVVRMRRGIGWLHPLAGVLRVWVDVRSMLGALTKRRLDWRGRDFVNVRSVNPQKNP